MHDSKLAQPQALLSTRERDKMSDKVADKMPYAQDRAIIFLPVFSCFSFQRVLVVKVLSSFVPGNGLLENEKKSAIATPVTFGTDEDSEAKVYPRRERRHV